MTVIRSLAKKLIQTYGHDKGKDIYSAMQEDNKLPFRKAMKTATKRGHTLKQFPRARKR